MDFFGGEITLKVAFNGETECSGFAVKCETRIPVTLTNPSLSYSEINDRDGPPFEKLN